MKVMIIALFPLLAQATAPASQNVHFTAQQMKETKFGCVDACKPPSPVESKCVTDCQQDMYQCIDETGPNENEDNTKACQDKVIQTYEDLNKEATKEKKEEKAEEKKEKKESSSFLQHDFAKMRKFESTYAKIEEDALRPVEKESHKSAFLQRDFARLHKIEGETDEDETDEGEMDEDQ